MMKHSPEPRRTVIRPADTAELVDALINGDVCEVPNRYSMKVFGALAYHGLCAEMEVNAENEGWTIYKLSERRY